MKLVQLILIIAICSFVINNSAVAQLSIGGTPASFNKTVKAAIPTVATSSIDLPTLLEEDELDAKNGIPFRFGFPFEVNYNLNNSGVWEKLNDGSKLWRLRIKCPNAYSINLIYDNFRLPEGAQFYIYNEDRSMVIGAFTSQNNKEHGQFATAPVKGEVSILELHVPADVSYPGEISIQRIIHGYKNVFFNWDLAKDALGYGSSGSCNNNVNCPEGDPWEEEIRSVAMITTSGGYRLCTGSLVNNVNQDLTPYFLTANHCLGGEQTWVFMFNYESPTCTNIDGPTWMTVSGSTLKATHTYSDFALLLISEQPPDSYNVFYSGWSAVDTAASSAVGIHHPSGDIKKISFDYDPVTSASWNGPSNTHWRVGQWEDGTTEPGSSGSPLFDPAHHVIGQLHGGSASCQSITSDYYGKFAKSWNYGGSSSSRLKDWLDPDNTGTLILDGIDATGLSFSADTTVGWIPLNVNFTATSKFPVDIWTWDFGDGDSAFVQNPTHLYQNPGPYDVKLETLSGVDIRFKTKKNYIAVIADTIIGSDVQEKSNSIEIPVYAHNNFPLETIKLPVEYSGDLLLSLDSFSTAGCRTDYFDIKEYFHWDPFNKRATIKLQSSLDGLQPELAAGSGIIIKLYFTIVSGQSNQTNIIQLDGYDSFEMKFFGSIVDYQPWIISGSITSAGCCLGIRGNIDNDPIDEINIADLVYFVDYSFSQPPGPEPPCFEEADVDASLSLDIGDIVYMVSYMFDSPPGPAPMDCP